MKKNKIPHLSFEEIRSEWEKTKTMDIRLRLKSMKQIVAAIGRSKEELTPESAVLYIDILKKAAQSPISEWNQASKILSKLIPEYLKITGRDQVEIIREAKSRDLEKGVYIIGDPIFIEEADPWKIDLDSKRLLDMMNSGKILSFGTQDGILGKARLRLVNADEPVIEVKEYKQLQSSTSTVVIRIESGAISILGEENEVQMSLEPGHYKICAYRIGRAPNFLIVLCKTTEDATNNLRNLNELHESF